jgi:nucleotide-binding universal stress UspA family protein
VIFDRVICGVDASEESLEAVRQGARLVAGEGRFLLLAVVEVDTAVHAGWAAANVLEQLKTEAESALDRAHQEIAHLRLAETRLVEGPAPARLLEEIAREKAGLLCLGTHEHRRIAGILIGSLTTTSCCSPLGSSHCDTVSPASAGRSVFARVPTPTPMSFASCRFTSMRSSGRSSSSPDSASISSRPGTSLPLGALPADSV